MTHPDSLRPRGSFATDRLLLRLLLLLLLSVLSVVAAAAQPLRGTYTVGGATSNFPNLGTATNAVTVRGVSGHVVFVIRSGTYTVSGTGLNSMTVGAAPGTGPNATITFRPDSGAIVRITSSTTSRGTANIRAGSWVIIDGRAIRGDTLSRMTIVNTSNTTGASAVLLDSNADNCIVRNCTLIANGSGGSGAVVKIRGMLGGVGSDSNTIENNVIGDAAGTYRADCGVLVEGGDDGELSSNRGNVVRGNTIMNMGRSGAEGFGVRVDIYCLGTTVERNTISINRTTASVALTGIADFSSADGLGANCRIDGNRIWGLASTSAQQRVLNGIIVDASGAGVGTTSYASRIDIVNNMVTILFNGRREEVHALGATAYNAGTRFTLNVDNNSFVVSDTSALDNSVIYSYSILLELFTVTTVGRPTIRLRNNVWDLQIHGGEGWHLESEGSDLLSDYNLVNIPAGADGQTLEVSYRSGSTTYEGPWDGLPVETTLDRRSIAGVMPYVNVAAGDLHVAQCDSSPGNNRALPLAHVTTDLDTDPRSATAPDIGADENYQTIDITAPSGGARFLAERPFEVRFNLVRSMTITIEYSCDDGGSWTPLGTVAGTSEFLNVVTVTAPATACSDAMIRLRGSDGRSCRVLNGTVEFYRPTVRVLAPNGGERFAPGDSTTVRWSAADADRLTIQYRSNAATGGTWQPLVQNLDARLGLWGWRLPTVPDTSYQVRIIVTAPISAEDVSDSSFTIAAPSPELTLLAPNGGELLTPGSTTAVSWSSANVAGRVMLAWSPDSGTTWLEIDTLDDVMAGSFDWMVPDHITSRALFRVRMFDGTAEDLSDAMWRIGREPAGGILVVYPNGGEIIEMVTTDSVLWDAAEDVALVNVQYSTDGGGSWFDIATSVPSVGGRNRIDWNTPNLPTMSSTALVRVLEVGSPTGRGDTSDAVFSILHNEGGVPYPGIAAAISLSPNPARETVTLTWSGRAPQVVTLMNVEGVRLWSGEVTRGTTSLTVPLDPSLPSGLYMMEYAADGRSVHLPVVVVR